MRMVSLAPPCAQKLIFFCFVDAVWSPLCWSGNGRVFAMPFDDHGRSMWQLSWRMSESDAMQLSQPGEAHCAALKVMEFGVDSSFVYHV